MPVQATYAGLKLAGTASFTMTQGVSPSSCSIWLVGHVLPPRSGSLWFSDEWGSVSFYPMIAIEPSFSEGPEGKLTRVTLVDKRFFWKRGYVEGIYNRPLGYTQYQERALSTLLKDCFDAVQTSYALFQIPNAYPEVVWEYDNPIAMVQDLCERYGLGIGLMNNGTAWVAPMNYFVGGWPSRRYKISEKATGNSWGPSSIIVVGNRLVNQECFYDLTAVGLETDGVIKPINDLSYTPSGGWGNSIVKLFSDISNEEHRKLALHCIFKWYAWIPDSLDVRWKKLPWLSHTCEEKTELAITTFDKPYVVVECSDFDGVTWLKGTKKRIDTGYTIDSENGLVMFDVPLVTMEDGPSSSSGATAAVVDLNVAYEKKGNGADDFYWYKQNMNGEGPAHVVHDSALTAFCIDGSPQNTTELRLKATEIINSVKEGLMEGYSETREYPGLVSVDAIGCFRSVTWTIGPSGSTTKISHSVERLPKFVPGATEKNSIRKIAVAVPWAGKTMRDRFDRLRQQEGRGIGR